MSTLITTTVQGVQNIKYDGSTTAMTIDSDGRVSTPVRPAFSTHRTSSLSISNTNATIVFNAVTHNQGGHYNSGTGIFTAPVSGLYFLSAALGVQNGADSRYFVIYLQTGDTDYQDLLLTRRDNAVNTTGTTYAGVNVSGVVSLNANDGVRVKAEMENSSNAVVSDKSCYFTGYFIG